MPATTRPTEPGYGFADVLTVTDATRSHLIHWTNIGIIRPDLAETTGRGFHRRFSTMNLIEVQLCSAIAKFKVPTDVMRGGVEIFKGHHRAMVAAHAVASTAFIPDPRIGAAAAELFQRQDQERDPLHGGLNQFEAARVWHELRTGSLIRGKPDPSWCHFVGLFLGSQSAQVAVDPTNLAVLVEESAIVIDLANVVFRVGERFSRLGLAPERW
jgi:hypothetical protein